MFCFLIDYKVHFSCELHSFLTSMSCISNIEAPSWSVKYTIGYLIKQNAPKCIMKEIR
jgi:hypothetical protein